MNFIDIAYASSEAAAEVAEKATDAGLLASLGINVNLLIFQFSH